MSDCGVMQCRAPIGVWSFVWTLPMPAQHNLSLLKEGHWDLHSPWVLHDQRFDQSPTADGG